LEGDTETATLQADPRRATSGDGTVGFYSLGLGGFIQTEPARPRGVRRSLLLLPVDRHVSPARSPSSGLRPVSSPFLVVVQRCGLQASDQSVRPVHRATRQAASHPSSAWHGTMRGTRQSWPVPRLPARAPRHLRRPRLWLCPWR
jgi:hypothetical protein